MICAVDPKKTGVGVGARAWGEYSFSTSVVDLEGGGRSVQWFVGHGGELDGITTDPVGHPNMFMTACSDGYVRLFNVRLPLPALMINSGVGKEGCAAVVLLHPDISLVCSSNLFWNFAMLMEYIAAFRGRVRADQDVGCTCPRGGV